MFLTKVLVCMFLSLIIFVYSLSFLSQSVPHFLSLMLIFELLTLGVVLLGAYFFSSASSSFGLYVFLIVLVCSVAEAVLGLSLLVSCSRSTGHPAVKSYSFMGL